MKRSNSHKALGFVFGAVLGLGGLSALAAVTLPNSFSTGTPIKASEVNANFNAVRDGINDLETRALTVGADKTASSATPALKLKNSGTGDAVSAEVGGSGIALQGVATTASGNGVYGYNSARGNVGYLGGANSGVFALGAQTALQVDGPIRVGNSNGTSKAAFVVTATAANTIGFTTCFDSYGNGDADAIVIVTPNSSGVRNNHPVGVSYSGPQWCVVNQDLGAIPVGMKFNVLVIKQ